MHSARADTMEDARWVLVTGVEHPTGRALAKELAGSWAIVTHSFTFDAAHAVAGEILSAGGNAYPIEADLTVAAATSQMYGELRARALTITALVHSASLPGPESTARPLNRIHPSDWGRFTHLHLSMLMHTVGGAVDIIDTDAASGAILTVSLPAAAYGRAGTLARATIDGATAAFTTTLARENRDPSLAVRHLHWPAGLAEAGIDTGIAAELRVALDSTARSTSRTVNPGKVAST